MAHDPERPEDSPAGPTEPAAGSMQTLPLFPLGNLVLPEGVTQLRIFEPRYVDMVRWALREDAGFVICLSELGDDGTTAQPRDAGCVVRISDFDTLDDGQLGIVAVGQHRVRIANPRRADDGLWLGDVTPLAAPGLPDDADVQARGEPPQPTPERHEHLADMVGQLLVELGEPHAIGTLHPADASWVGFRLTELMPLHPDVKHDLLECTDAVERLDRLDFLISQMIQAARPD